MKVRRGLECLGLLLFVSATAQAAEPVSNKVDLKALASRAEPGAAHKALQPLVGKFKVEKKIFVAMGTKNKPAISVAMTATREWVGDGRFLREITQGKVNGAPYWREGLLGFNPSNQRYEWSTADNVTPIMMQYRSKNGTMRYNPIELSGAFTDLGVTGEENVGKPVMMRTVITITDNDHHTFEIYFTTPEGTELLADRMDLTRTK